MWIVVALLGLLVLWLFTYSKREGLATDEAMLLQQNAESIKELKTQISKLKTLESKVTELSGKQEANQKMLESLTDQVLSTK